MKMNIEIDNITEAQYYAIQALLDCWQYYGEIGISRWTAFMADGDGNFRPKIKVDGKNVFLPDQAADCSKSSPFEINPKDGDYAIDYDCIAWKSTNEYL